MMLSKGKINNNLINKWEEEMNGEFRKKIDDFMTANNK